MNDWGIENDFIEVSGETRTNTKVFEKSGELTELNEPGTSSCRRRCESTAGKA